MRRSRLVKRGGGLVCILLPGILLPGIFLPGIFLPTIPSWLKSHPGLEKSYDRFAASALVALGTMHTIAMIYAILFRTHLSRYTKKWITIQGSREEFVAAIFFRSSIIVPLLYFRFLYDPKALSSPHGQNNWVSL